MAGQYIIVCIDILFIHLSVDGQLSYFNFLAILNDIAMNIGAQTAACIPPFNFFGYIPKNGIAGPTQF